ncbi:MAG: nicotinate-nucleotide adenylyltransferase [Candidatus Rokuibacteriota bacterium]
MTRTAILGGSFNPIHYGHLLLADDLLERLRFDRVLFVPAGVPPHKSATTLAPAADRYAMVKLAVADHPRFGVSDLELRRSGPSYTVDTLSALASTDQALFLIVGSETFLDLLSWRTPRRIAELARLVVVPRAGSVFDPEVAPAQKVLREIGATRFVVFETGPVPDEGVLVVHATSLPISASELRHRAGTGRSLAYRLPPAVVEYIRGRGLYDGHPA